MCAIAITQFAENLLHTHTIVTKEIYARMKMVHKETESIYRGFELLNDTHTAAAASMQSRASVLTDRTHAFTHSRTYIGIHIVSLCFNERRTIKEVFFFIIVTVMRPFSYDPMTFVSSSSIFFPEVGLFISLG